MAGWVRTVRHVRLEPFAHRLDGGDVARAVVLPQAEEAPQLALEVAGRLAEALEAGVAPVDGVDLDERVDELLADAPAVVGAVERGRHRARDDVALDALHDEEGRADDRLVVADGEHGGHARAAGERRQHARLAQDVVGAGRQRAARRAAQDDVGALAAQGVGHVGMALADRLDLDVAGAELWASRKAMQRLEDEQRLALVGLALGVGADDVVRGDLGAHRRKP